MLLLCPLAFLVLGLGLGGGLFYASHRVRSRMQIIANARPCKAGSPGEGVVKLHGKVKAVDPTELLISPMEQKPCVYYKLVIEQYQQSAVVSSGPSRRGSSGSWVRIIEDEQAIPMVVADETGEVAVDALQATLDFRLSRHHANMLSSLPKELEESLKARYKIVTSTWFIPKQMRYTEVVIAQDQEVFVVGTAETRDGKTRLTKKDSELLMTFRKEEQVLRNGKITSIVMTILAVVFPLVFFVLAWFAYKDATGLGPQPNQNATQDGGKEAIATLKNTKASLSDRAWAARRLSGTPVTKSQVATVAPLLNPLLDSRDNFHRESAALAIKQGWGNSMNEDALKRAQDSTKDARIRGELAAALSKVGR